MGQKGTFLSFKETPHMWNTAARTNNTAQGGFLNSCSESEVILRTVEILSEAI